MLALLVREVVTVGRIVVFGGTGNTMDDLYAAEEVREKKYIGISSAKSKSYVQGYQCRHLGYGVDKNVQVPTILTNAGIPVTLIGKVADIVINDAGLSELISMLTEEDILVVQADHGNDPNIGHSKHTRENVPLLVYRKGVKGVKLGLRSTLSDVGASVCDFFCVTPPENGSSFLSLL